MNSIFVNYIFQYVSTPGMLLFTVCALQCTILPFQVVQHPFPASSGPRPVNSIMEFIKPA